MAAAFARRSLGAAVLALALALGPGLPATPARAAGPDGQTVREPYSYPPGPEGPEGYPRGWVRVPAAAADLLLVRPVLVTGLAAGAVAFVATLPITAATLTTDDAARALADQARSAVTRPLGVF
ncbi:MAG TPA: hypothetical protein VIN04_06930 [Myxococcota bacterium]